MINKCEKFKKERTYIKAQNESKDVLQFEDLFDLDEIQKIQDSFSLATGMASLIIKPDGTPITKPSGFCDICNAIRQTEIGLKNCRISDAAIGKMVKDGPIIQRCLSGHLLDAGASIIVDGQHLGSWLVGQVILEGDTEDKMLEYADEVGIDPEIYRKLLKKVRQISYEQFENIGRFLYLNAKYLSEIAHQKLTLTKEVDLRIEREKEIIYIGNHDYLTGLYNRRFFEDELKRLDTERNFPLTILMGDVNGLKLINDSFGHSLGDELLVKISRILKLAFRSDDIIARVGGDEFIIILPKTEGVEVEKMIGRVKNLLSKEKLGNSEFSISFGYAVKTHVDQNSADILKDAENIMYRHKIYESSSMRSNTIELIMKALYEKNNREMFHSRRVSEICEAIAIKMRFTKDEVKRIRITGLMHDIGKIGIDEKILNSEQKLSENELLEIRKHPDIGFRILSASNEFSSIAEDVLQHHERWDGHGYPKGLKSEEISLNARIIALADTYDALISDRVYRKAYSKEYAIKEIERCSGNQFDPKLVRVFIELMRT